MSSATVTSQPRPFVTIAHSWSSGICDCFSDLPQCCFAFWCLPCFACITAREAGECLCLPLLDYIGAFPAINTGLRVSIRQRYGIEGSICNDCAYAFFCGPCSWCQISREMKKRKSPVAIA